MEESGQRLDLVTRLHLLDLRHVGRIEQLSADQRQCERGRGAEHLVDAWRCRTLPVGACNQIAPGCAGRGPTADVAVVIGIAVDQLHRVVAFFGDGRHGDHQRLGAQVGPEKGVRRVAVGGNDGRVSGGRDLMIVVQLVEGGLELAGAGVHREFVHHGVVHDQRQAVDKAFLGDRLGLLQARRGNALGHIRLVGLCDRIELARAPGEKR
ncbi:hypothetical protein D3C81_1134440 [compost metagenome]